MSGRRAGMILIAGLGAGLLVPACSPATRYRVLSFFFDGVPEPGQPSVAAGGPTVATGPQEAGEAARRATHLEVFVHAPFREKRCSACHNMNTGQLTKEVRAGLCLDCHASPAKDAPYLHGPVAVNDCVACHHPHASPYPKLLLEDVHTLCFRCHRRADLSPEPHDASVEGQACTVCHDPHGGADRFFLK